MNQQYYGERKQYANQRPSYNSSFINGKYSRGVETKLLPNEMRISSRGNLSMYLDSALKMLNGEFEHLKIVGRGEAVNLSQELLHLL